MHTHTYTLTQYTLTPNISTIIYAFIKAQNIFTSTISVLFVYLDMVVEDSIKVHW